MKIVATALVFLFFLAPIAGAAQVVTGHCELHFFETVITVAAPCKVDTVSNVALNIITGKDTIHATWMNYYNAGDDTSGYMRTYTLSNGDTIRSLSTYNNALKYDSFPIPFSWLSALSPGGESFEEEAAAEMNNPGVALIDSFPLLRTHKAQIITNKFRDEGSQDYFYEKIIILTPIDKKRGRMYVLQPYDCYKGVDFVVIETSPADAKGQQRYMNMFKTMKFQ